MLTEEQAAAAGVISVLFIIFYWIPSFIVFARLYGKAGQPGWSAFVPVYNRVVMAKISDKPLWLGLVVGIAGTLSAIGQYTIGSKGGLTLLANLVWLIFGLWLLNSFMKKFDRGLGFWVLWLLLPIIAVFTAGRAQYKGSVAAGTTPATPGPSTPPAVPPATPPAAPAETPPTVAPAAAPTVPPATPPTEPGSPA